MSPRSIQCIPSFFCKTRAEIDGDGFCEADFVKLPEGFEVVGKTVEDDGSPPLQSIGRGAVFFTVRLPTRESRVTTLGEGEMAEWSIASVLKTEGPKGPVGSNPTLSAIFFPK